MSEPTNRNGIRVLDVPPRWRRELVDLVRQSKPTIESKEKGLAADEGICQAERENPMPVARPAPAPPLPKVAEALPLERCWTPGCKWTGIYQTTRGARCYNCVTAILLQEWRREPAA